MHVYVDPNWHMCTCTDRDGDVTGKQTGPGEGPLPVMMVDGQIVERSEPPARHRCDDPELLCLFTLQ